MVIGWDIGGVNTKVARVGGGEVFAVRNRPFELQLAPSTLSALLGELAAEVGMQSGDAHAVTMTAELSQMFRTKRDGVSFVLDAVAGAFPDASVHVFTVDGDFIDPHEARLHPLAVAAANWTATAHVVAGLHPDAILIDVGTTTTDIIPIAGGAVVAAGRTDPQRLASGELVYSGALRTPVEAITSHVPFRGAAAGVSAEGFALAGDVHVWRGDLAPSDYTVATPDRRPASRECAGERLARVVCADRELLDEAGVDSIADAIAAAQIRQIAAGIEKVGTRHPLVATAVVTGLGAFLGRAAARAAGLDVVPLAAELGDAGARCAPAVCVALLFAEQTKALHKGAPFAGRAFTARQPLTVVKIGGGVLANPEHFDAAIAAAAGMARQQRILVVPGGGPFADAVRDVDLRVGVSDDASHWMAILAMDQYAHLIVDRLERGAIATTLSEICEIAASGRIPVLAPARWLREADPLPHSWDVTSDSIAAWVAGQAGGERLVLIKPAGAAGSAIVDRHFAQACPPGVAVVVAPVDSLAEHVTRT
jgi:probable H4MPT-linked C1 transfer pathway protein